MSLEVDRALKRLDVEIREAMRTFAHTGSRLIDCLNRRDTMRRTLRSRRPHWCTEDAAWDEYRLRITDQLTEAEGMIQFHEATMTKLDEEIGELQRAERELEERQRLQPVLFA